MTEIPKCGPEPRFAVGETVIVARVLDTLTSPGLVGFVGTVREVESLPPGEFATACGYTPRHIQHNYDVDGRYLNEQMLEAAGAGEVLRLRAALQAIVTMAEPAGYGERSKAQIRDVARRALDGPKQGS